MVVLFKYLKDTSQKKESRLVDQKKEEAGNTAEKIQSRFWKDF